MLSFAQQHSWLIAVLPVWSFVIIAFLMLISGKTQELARRLAPITLMVCLGGSLLLALYTLIGMQIAAGGLGHALSGAGHLWFQRTATWLSPEPIGQIDRTLKVGVLLDPLSTVMLVVVTLVSLLVQIYSYGYMKREEHPRFYLYMSLFTASMLGLVISASLLQLFLCWEMVGLCSYLLIGFWFTKPEAARAAIKAFVVTRFGDLGLLIAVIALWFGYGDLTFSSLQHAITTNAAPAALPFSLTIVGVLIFIGACGKSAQFPLHVWLPDAMEGPTSVSALIHAATMVAAGVFLVARMFFLFQAAPIALIVVALVGGFTALFAASIALVQVDMKKVMAYSTISQLGYMMMGLGLAAPAAAFFHLTTHAFFKALLFLTAGSVIHATHTQNIWEMGGLFRKMKITAITCLIGGLALAGVIPFAGYYSKHKLLEAALASATGFGPHWAVLSHGLAWLLLLMALAVVVMTAFYTTRMWVLVFLGQPRSEGAKHAHESPGSMTFSLIVLGAFSCVAGLVLVPQLTGLVGGPEAELPSKMLLTGVSLVLALGGIAWGYRMYVKSPAVEPLRKLGWLYTGMVNLWYVDAFFTWLARRVVLALATFIARFDKGVIDGGLVDGTAWLTGRFGYAIRRISAGSLPGQLQYYAIIIFGVAALVMLAMAAREYPSIASMMGELGR